MTDPLTLTMSLHPKPPTLCRTCGLYIEELTWYGQGEHVWCRQEREQRERDEKLLHPVGD